MKKLLRTLFIIILLLGAWFMYIVKNPELPISQKILTTIGLDMVSSGKQKAIDPDCISYFDGCNTCMVSWWIIEWCTKMFCDTPTEPQCLEYTRTGMDLTNCVSYFDGCNNCSVKDGRPDACTLMYCETPGEPKCNEYASGADVKINLQNCKSYFDGCNTCSVKDGQPEACTEMYCETPSEPKCLELNNEETVSPDSKGEWTACNSDAKLCDDGSSVGRSWPNCEFAPCPSEEPTVCTMEYAPVCASVQVECIKAPCPPIEQTFGNKCMMNANKRATYLHDGECTTK